MEDVSNIPPLREVTDSDVNFEINDTDLTIGRVRHPKIRRQLQAWLLEQATEKLRPYKEDTWEPHLPEGWDGTERFKLFRNTRTGTVTDSEELEKLRATPYPSEDDISHDVDERIARAEMVTNIDFTTQGPDAERMGMAWQVPWAATLSKPTTKQWSIIEAHEKGHLLRPYDDKFFYAKLRAGFDLSAVKFTQEDFDMLLRQSNQNVDVPDEDSPTPAMETHGPEFLEHYLFTPVEIAERMAQLKNYFGFEGGEVFTKNHLDYARGHYIRDTGMDNGMRLFFEAIVPATEPQFLELINNAGI